MAIVLDPREVLLHLNELGYCNITAEQLRDFIRDLKKLIKYDIERCTCINISEDNAFEKSAELCTQNRVNPCSSANQNKIPEKQSQDVQSTRLQKPESSKTVSTDEGIYEEPRIEASDSTDFPINGCKQKKLQKMKNKLGKENQPDTATYTGRTKSSFIRPWQLQPGNGQGKSDPVALYHHYQNIWQKQKVPGEDAHSDLRWRIRERMLGQDPHPRPVSQASSVESLMRKRRS